MIIVTVKLVDFYGKPLYYLRFMELYNTHSWFNHLCTSANISMYLDYLDDDHRISLVPLPNFPECQNDYINASYIDVCKFIYNVVTIICKCFIINTAHFNNIYDSIKGFSETNKFIASQGMYTHPESTFTTLLHKLHLSD